MIPRIIFSRKRTDAGTCEPAHALQPLRLARNEAAETCAPTAFGAVRVRMLDQMKWREKDIRLVHPYEPLLSRVYSSSVVGGESRMLSPIHVILGQEAVLALGGIPSARLLNLYVASALAFTPATA